MYTHVRMRRIIFLFTGFGLLFPTMHLSAQILTTEHHTPQCNDSLLAYKVAYIVSADTGRNCVWNFSDLSTDNAEVVEVDYYMALADDTTHIGLHRERTNYYYHIANDTLWQKSYETSRAYVEYAPRVPLLRFPFVYGDTMTGTFHGKGQYCHMSPLNIEGFIRVKADGAGCLILPEDTIDKALRVHSQMEYREKKHQKNCVQEERSAWYSPYCRYPLVESVRVQTIKNTDTITFASTYYYPQEQDEELRERDIEADEENAEADSLVSNIRFMPNPVYNDVQIYYSLSRPAQVYISLHYNGGLTTYQSPLHHEEEGEHSVSVNMSGMPIGSYVVYIHADDIVGSGSLIKL